VRSYLSRAGSLPESSWVEPRAPGKWSRAELTQHLILTYEGLVAELSGGPGIRVRFKGVKLLALRLFVLPRFLRRGVFPPGVRSPKEVAPSGGDPDRAAAIGRLEASCLAFEEAIAAGAARGNGRITHPFFGPLSLGQGVRFAEVHLRHHTRQLPGS